MTNKEEPEKLLDNILEFDCWPTKEELIKKAIDKLKELGYSASADIDSNVINVMCEHGKICRVISLIDDCPEKGFPWSIDNVYDYDTIKDNVKQLKPLCQICKKRKTIEYMFDGDVLKFWDKEKSESGDFEEIDLNDIIDWYAVNNKAIERMKEIFPKGTKFVDVDEE